MAEYLTPGVYIEEIPSGPVPIQGVSTSTIGFVGMAQRGPTQPKLLTSWIDYQRWYGGYTDPDKQEGYLPWSVQGFFENGGQRAFVARIAKQNAATANRLIAADPLYAAHSIAESLTGAVNEAEVVKGEAEARQSAAEAGSDDAKAAADDVKRAQNLIAALTPAQTQAEANAVSAVKALTAGAPAAAEAAGKAVIYLDLTARITVEGKELVDEAYDISRKLAKAAAESGSADAKTEADAYAKVAKDLDAILAKMVTGLKTATANAKKVSDKAAAGEEDSATINTMQGVASGFLTANLTPMTEKMGMAPPSEDDYPADPPALIVSASGPGQWGNNIVVKVGEAVQRDETANPPRPWFSLEVMYYDGGVPVPFMDPDNANNVVKPGFRTPDVREFFDNLSMDPNSPHYVMTQVNSSSKLIAVAPGNLPVPPQIPDPDARLIQSASSSHEFLTADKQPGTGMFIWAREMGEVGNDIEISLEAVPQTNGASAETVLKMSVTPGEGAAESYDGMAITKLPTYVNRVSKLIKLSWDPLISAEALKTMQPAVVEGTKGVSICITEDGTGPRANLEGGKDGNAGLPAKAYYEGSNPENIKKPPEMQSGLEGLKHIRNISLLCIPDEGIVQGLTQSIVQQCEELKNRFGVLQFKASPGDVQNIVPLIDTSYAAVYYPWINVLHPIKNKPVLIPPGGHIAGVYAGTDVSRGVFKAPANETLMGPLLQDIGDTGPLATKINDGQQAILNPKGVNCIRDFRTEGRGILVWGARTQSTDGQWRYLNVRRTFIFVEQSVKLGTQWVVFEPNDEFTWTRVAASVTNFLTTVWKSGALFGTTPQEAFFVRCDATTMTQDDIDNGRLVCYVGIAPVKPAEFVVFRFSQKTASAES